MHVGYTLSGIRETVAGGVRAELARRRMSASELARQTGLKQSYLSRRMTGETPFNVDDLAQIAAALRVPMSTLIPSGLITSDADQRNVA